jgi:hypothetical protein
MQSQTMRYASQAMRYASQAMRYAVPDYEVSSDSICKAAASHKPLVLSPRVAGETGLWHRPTGGGEGVGTRLILCRDLTEAGIIAWAGEVGMRLH